MRVCRHARALLAVLFVAGAVARAEDAAPPRGPVPANPVPDAETLRRELAASYHAAPLILAAYEVRKTVHGVQQDTVVLGEAYRAGSVAAVRFDGEGHKSLMVMGPDDGRTVVDGKVVVHLTGGKAVSAATDAFNAALLRLSNAWGHPLQPIRLFEPALSVGIQPSGQGAKFTASLKAFHDTRANPQWLLPDDFRDTVATIVDGGAAVRFERKDEVLVVRRADGMPDLWVLDRPADHARGELRRVEAACSRDAWAAAVSEALLLDPAGVPSTTFLEVLQAKGGRWDVACLRAMFTALDSSWPAWRDDAARRSAAEAEVRVGWKESRRSLGLPNEPGADEREVLEAALREGLTASPASAPSK